MPPCLYLSTGHSRSVYKDCSILPGPPIRRVIGASQNTFHLVFHTSMKAKSITLQGLSKKDARDPYKFVWENSNILPSLYRLFLTTGCAPCHSLSCGHNSPSVRMQCLLVIEIAERPYVPSFVLHQANSVCSSNSST